MTTLALWMQTRLPDMTYEKEPWEPCKLVRGARLEGLSYHYYYRSTHRTARRTCPSSVCRPPQLDVSSQAVEQLNTLRRTRLCSREDSYISIN